MSSDEICEYCGQEIEENDQRCPARDDGECSPDLEVRSGEELVDGHGRIVYAVAEEVVQLHHRAIAAGWEHTHGRTPFENLRGLLEAVDAKRSTIQAFAYRYIAGFGPKYAPRALDRLEQEGEL